jgi:Skp family chaperone for outer membrane proteins
MKPFFTRIRIRPTLLSLFLILTFAAGEAMAQDYWDKIPVLTSQCYGEHDDFGKKIQQLKSEIKEKLEKSKKAVEEKANKMTDEEKMAMAMRYQKMTPEEIIKMQNEMMQMNQLQTEFQQLAASMETDFNQLESDFRSAFGKTLGPIEDEYRKLPDGEGTPEWAIKKGEELMITYNKAYESICDTYFTSVNAKFKNWLKDYHTFLVDHEIPFNQKMLKSQYAQFGFTPDEAVASQIAVEKYLDKCLLIFGFRRPYPQG